MSITFGPSPGASSPATGTAIRPGAADRLSARGQLVRLDGGLTALMTGCAEVGLGPSALDGAAFECHRCAVAQTWGGHSCRCRQTAAPSLIPSRTPAGSFGMLLGGMATITRSAPVVNLGDRQWRGAGFGGEVGEGLRAAGVRDRDLVSERGEASGEGGADVAGTDDGDVHGRFLA